jgi:lysozyme
MDRQKIYAQLVVDEGVRLTVYRDTIGLLTVGVGHLVLPEDGLHLGDTITEARCEEFFNRDLDTAIYECIKLVENFDGLPEAAQEVLVNMMFNMGPARLGEFHHFLRHVQSAQWIMASHDMQASAWHGQVGIRAKRLEAQIEALAL